MAVLNNQPEGGFVVRAGRRLIQFASATKADAIAIILEKRAALAAIKLQRLSAVPVQLS